MKTSICICFMGIDGSGKTLHAVSLSKNLSKVGIYSFYIRPEHLLEKFLPHTLIRRASRYFFTTSKIKMGKPEFIKHQRNNDIKMSFSKFMLMVGFLVYVWLMHALIIKPRLRKYVLIYDRYFYDWIYHLDRKRFAVWMRLIPKPDLIFILDVDVPEAFSRMHSSEDKKFSTNYYSSLREWYLTLAKKYGFVVLNSMRNFTQTKKRIFELTISSLRMRDLFVS